MCNFKGFGSESPYKGKGGEIRGGEEGTYGEGRNGGGQNRGLIMVHCRWEMDAPSCFFWYLRCCKIIGHAQTNSKWRLTDWM